MKLFLNKSIPHTTSEIQISGSKSETNRLLLLQALYPNITVENVSNADDSQVMIKALQSSDGTIDIHHAGTTMRFLTAYFSMQQDKEVVLTGSARMKERPIQILVDALRQMGADIEYINQQGFPPLKIKGKTLKQNKVILPANISSQYISALLLIAPKLENGLELILQGEITSVPYINMTLALLKEVGVKSSFIDNKIHVMPQPVLVNRINLTVESDWSSASYFYSIVALSEVGTKIKLSSYKQNSLQGDSILAEIYKGFGVETVFENNIILLHKKEEGTLSFLTFDLNKAPDIAQTLAVTCFGTGIGCHLTGLHTLKIKETDRLTALQNELTKLGASISTTNDTLTLAASAQKEKIENTVIATYQDHRMAMAFAPLALKIPLFIDEAEVVSKSYPNFWMDLKEVGFVIAEL